MRFITWLAVYVLTFAAEISFLPSFFHSVVPLSFSVLILGIALQEFEPGFWFAGLAGFSHDLVAPHAAGSHTVFFLAVFFSVHAFASVTQWEEPLRKISKVVVGLITAPVLWMLSTASVRIFFTSAVPTVRWADMPRMLTRGDYLFVSAWVILFAYVSLRRFQHERGHGFGRLSS